MAAEEIIMSQNSSTQIEVLVSLLLDNVEMKCSRGPFMDRFLVDLDTSLSLFAGESFVHFF